jgi:hypothetical protein
MLSDKKLLQFGLRPWGRKHEHHDGTEYGPMLWLFPGEWYEHIPEGFEVVTLRFQRERFTRRETDNDIRFGCLAYGILKD